MASDQTPPGALPSTPGAADSAQPASRTARDRKGRRLLWGGCGLLLITGIILGRRLPGTLLDTGMPVETATGDIVYVLPGNEDIRPWWAAELLRSGRVAKIVISVEPASSEPVGVVADEAREFDLRVLQSRGVPSEDVIVLPATGNTTFSDLETLRPFVAAHPTEQVLILTNGYHTRRVCWCVRQVLGPNAANVQVVSAPNPRFHLQTWWKTGRGRHHILWEWLKLVYYLLRYTSAGWWGLGLGSAAVLTTRRRRRKHGDYQ